MIYCANCEASLTSTDFDAGYCTQCHTPTKKPSVFIRCECHGREFKREASYRYHMNTQRKQQTTTIDKGGWDHERHSSQR